MHLFQNLIEIYLPVKKITSICISPNKKIVLLALILSVFWMKSYVCNCAGKVSDAFQKLS